MDIIAAYREAGTFRGAAEIAGTTHKTVKRVIARHEAGGAARVRVQRGHNYDGVAALVAERVEKTAGRISAKRLLPAARAAGSGHRRGTGRAGGDWCRCGNRSAPPPRLPLHGSGRRGLRRGFGLLPVLGGDLPGLLTYLLVADAQPLQRACGHALVLGCQAEQEMAGTQWRWPSRRASRKATATTSRAGLAKGRNPVARVWMPGVCLRRGRMAASWVRMIHLARVLGLGCGAGMGASWRVMRGPWAASWRAAVRHRPELASGSGCPA